MLFTCVGRRVELVQAFRRAAARSGIRMVVIGADASWLAPAMHLCDRAVLVPGVARADYVRSLLRIVRDHEVDLLVPLIDHELLILSKARDRFAQAGCTALISSERVVATCRDKIRTFRFLTSNGIDTPRTWTLTEALKLRRHRFPYFMKPRAGSAGLGSYKITNADELRTLGRRVPQAIVQEFVPGVEHTLDVYAGFDGRARCVVPRRRIEVRGGEVGKALVVKDARMIETGRRVVEALGECVGVITIQCIATPGGRIRVIEINPRFGGGVPLAIRAGADFPRWLMMEHFGRRPRIGIDRYRDCVQMLRYDQSVFTDSLDQRGQRPAGGRYSPEPPA